MALISDDLLSAANAAGIPDAATLQDMLTIVKAFQPVLKAAAQSANISLADASTAFATRASLQLEAIAIGAEIANAIAARDAAMSTANTGIDALKSRLNTVNGQLQQAVAGS